MKLYDDQLIIITGAAGFIGSCVIRHLNDQGIFNIVVVDDLGKTEKWKNLVGKRIVDVISKHQLFNWLEGRESLIEAFIHLGACSSTTETDCDYLMDNNFRFSQKLALYAKKNQQRFIYASSAATYGEGTEGFVDDENRIDSLRPMNAYGFSKQIFDSWLKNEGLLNHVVGLKYFNVFGPNEWHKGRMASVVLHMLPTVQKEGVVRLFQSSDPEKFGNGEQKRDFIYVKDAAKMTCAFLTNEAYGIFNIARGIPETWNSMAAAVFKAVDKPCKIEYIPMPADLIGKYQNYSCADMKKTHAVLKNSAKCMSFEDSIVDYVRNHLIPGKTW